MSDNNEPGLDLSEPGERDNAAQKASDASQPSSHPGEQNKPAPAPAKQPLHKSDEIYLEREKDDNDERRFMRYVVFVVIIAFACFFLGCGLNLALNVGNGLIEAKTSIVNSLTGKCVSSIPFRCATEAAHPVVIHPTSISNLNTDWLSASSLIAIVAIVLGVGLTLILTLLKASFRHPTDKEARNNDDKTIELATPLSELIVGALNGLKDKFFK